MLAALEAELEAAHARCEWRTTGSEIERRLGVCRHCPAGGEFLRYGCPRWPFVRVYVARLVAESADCQFLAAIRE